MAIAEASQSRLAYVAEVTPGVIPATPSFKTLRLVNENIRLAKQSVVSDELRGDGNVTSIIDVGRSVEGPIAGELSYGTFDDFFEALFRSTWSTNVLKNGIAHKTFAFEKTFEQGATDSFIRYRGCRVNTLDLTLEARQIARVSFGIMGIGSPTPTSAIITGATYAAPSTTPVLNAATNVGALAMTGVTATPKIRSLNLSIRSNIYQNDVVGAYEPDSHGLGRFEVSGTMQAYFENLDLYSAIIDHTDVSLSTTIGAASGSKYTLALPKLKLMEGSPVIGGNSQAVIMEVPFQAYYDGTSAATATLTRAVA